MREVGPRQLWDRIRGLLGVRPIEPTFRESLEELIEEHHDDGVPGAEEQRTMFRNLLDFGRLDVADVMVPRADIISIPADITTNQLISLICEQGHSRLPVHRGTLDDVLGMVHIRDIIAFWERKPNKLYFTLFFEVSRSDPKARVRVYKIENLNLGNTSTTL